MKKLLLCAILLASFSNIFANFSTQGNWRWRNDDGSQTTATWRADQNTPITIASIGETLRLRIELYNDPAKAGGFLDDAELQDSVPGWPAWRKIKVIAGAGDPFVLAGTSPNVTDLEATTEQLTAKHYSVFLPGSVMVSSDTIPEGTSLGNTTGSEYEYVIKSTQNLQPSTTYYFRVWANSEIYKVALPTLTTAAVLPVKLVSFTAVSEGKFVRLDWTTSSEESNDRFEVQRSSNSANWETISTIKGKGTVSTSTRYTAYDNKPLLGENYYRLKQIDINGQSATSGVKLVNIFESGNASIVVAPNPSNTSISFTFHNKQASEVVALLSDANGKVMHQEKFKNVASGNINRLSLKQKPSAGIYFLKIYADGVSHSMKVLLQ